MPSRQPNGDPRKRHKTRHPGVFYRIGRDGKRAYCIGYRDESGKQHWQRVHGDQEAAREELADIKRKQRQGESVRPDTTTLRDFYREHGDDCIATIKVRKESVKREYRKTFERYALREFGDTPLQKIKPGRLENWIGTLARRGGKDGRPLKAWTVKNAVTPFRNLLDHAKREALIVTNPLRAINLDGMLPDDEGEKCVLTREELARLIASTSERFRPAVTLLAATGFRASELLGLVWGDLDLKAGVVRLRFQLAEDEDGRLVRGELKTKNAVRNTRIDPGLAARLTQHRLAAFHSDDGDYVFAREDGSPWSLRVFANGFSRAARGAGLRDDPERPNATPHSLRHTYASRLIAGGNDVVRVSKALGHANANITLTIYAHEFDQRNDDGSYVDAIAV